MLTGRVVGAERVIAGLSMVPEETRKRVRRTIASLVVEVTRKVKAEKLSGQVLKNRTGTLRRSINQRVEESALEIVGSVGTNVRYAKRWELGYEGPESVRAHLRIAKAVFGRTLASPVQMQVRAFTRELHVKPRPFLRPVLEEMRATIRTRIEAAVRGER